MEETKEYTIKVTKYKGVIVDVESVMNISDFLEVSRFLKKDFFKKMNAGE